MPDRRKLKIKNTYQSIHISAPIDEVWRKVKNFHDMSWAPSVIVSCTSMGDKNGETIGAKRLLNDSFHETLIELDEAEHLIRYCITEGPSPVSSQDVKDYIGKLQLFPVTKDDTTFVAWSSSWQAGSDDATEFCSGIYVALLDDLANRFA